MDSSVESSVMVVRPRGSQDQHTSMRGLCVALATRRFETLKNSDLPFGSRRGRYNNDWTGDANDTPGFRRAWVAGRVWILIWFMRRSRLGLQRTTTTDLA